MKSGLLRAWREYRGFAVFIVLMVIFRSALADWNVVPTGSMKPTIVEGDRILVNKLAYDFKIPLTHISLHKFADPGRGDIVVFDSRAADTRLVKRVIGLPGDTVSVSNGTVVLNGRELHENYVPAEYRDHISMLPVRIPKDQYFVLGDHRSSSNDSRMWGLVPRSYIYGKAVFVFWPPAYVGTVR